MSEDQNVTAKYFSKKFICKNKINLTTITILEYIYSWVLSDKPPENTFANRKKHFYISQSHIAKDFDGLITNSGVCRIIKKIKLSGIIQNTSYFDKEGKFYVSFNWDKVLESLAPQSILEKQKYKFNSNWFTKIFDFIQEEKRLESLPPEKTEDDIKFEIFRNQYKNIFHRDSNNCEAENMAGLLSDKDLQINKPKYPKQADAIAKRILIKYPQFFLTKYPLSNEQPTKTYTRLCLKITDIFNGSFTNPRFYNFDENVFKNKQFNTEGWKEKLKEVKGDWSKVKKLIFHAVENFILMYDQTRMPMNKDYLTNNLNDWFYSDNPNSKGQSQFIQSLNEPMFQKQKLGLDKAKNIVQEIKEKSPISYYAGHELNNLLPEKANELIAWQFIQDIIKWGKLLYQYDENATYFLECKINGNLESGPKVLPALFARYLEEKDISVSLNTLNIEQAIDSNGPWCWFIDDACKKHGLNKNILHCLDKDDFYDAYNKLSFDDMSEVIF